MLSLLATLALAPQFFDETVVEPARYASASGGYTLAVEPSARDGSGPCQVRMDRAGAELWSRELPFTFVGAAVTSGGQVVGYAFDEGVDVGRGFLHEVVLDARGGVLQDRRTERWWCRYVVCPPPPEPNVLGLVLDEEHDRAIVRIADDDWTRAQEQWRVVRISTGEPLEDVRPTAGLVHDEEQLQRVWAARALPGTDLFLLHARTWTYKTQVGSVFALVDLAGRVAWRLDLPHDLELERAEIEDLERRVEEHGCLLAVPAPRTFDAWFEVQVHERGGRRGRFRGREDEGVALPLEHLPPAVLRRRASNRTRCPSRTTAATTVARRSWTSACPRASCGTSRSAPPTPTCSTRSRRRGSTPATTAARAGRQPRRSARPRPSLGRGAGRRAVPDGRRRQGRCTLQLWPRSVERRMPAELAA